MNYYQVGKIVNTHGVKGEVKVVTTSDFIDLRLKVGKKIDVFSPDDKQHRKLQIASKRLHKNMVLLTFQEIDSMSAAEQLKQWNIKVEETDLHQLAEGEYYFHQIINCEVFIEDGTKLGHIHEILTPGANHVWVVLSHNGKEILLPVIDQVILDVDVDSKRVIVHLMEGLI
jgi:16S rRNA processing protein RimM